MNEKICYLKAKASTCKDPPLRLISFKAPKFLKFNRAIMKLVHRSEPLPSYLEVYELLVKYNAKYKMRLNSREMPQVTQEACRIINNKMKRLREAHEKRGRVAEAIHQYNLTIYK